MGNLGLVKANKEGLNSKQISTTSKNETYLTTLQALYEANEYLLRAFEGGMDVDAKFKANRPSAEVLDAYYDFLASIWNEICEASPDLKPIIEKRQKAGSLRIDVKLGGGGSAIGRPIGQLIVAELISAALRQGQEQKPFIQRLFGEVSFNLDDVPWVKLVWNPQSRSIMGGKRERLLIVNLLLHKFDLKTSIGPRQLLRDYRDIAQDKKMKLLATRTEDAGEAEE